MITLMEIINPRYQLHNYPPTISKTVPPKTPEEQKKIKLLAIPMMILLIIYLIWTGVKAYSNIEVSYFTLFLHYFIVIIMWNIFDLLIMDWLIFCTITPKFLVISGTEGNLAYKDYKFHLNGVIGKSLIYAIICTIFVSGITFLLLRILN